ncbi:MAG: phage head closure protein [Pseudomonadota bacterium]|nr:phage head closure protein [Pseudomonadota bacterium]
MPDAPRVQPGQIDQRITIQSENSTADGAGGFVLAWSDVATVWAMVEPLTGREREEAGRLEGAVRYRVTVRYRAGLTTSNRIVWRSTPMQVREVHEAGPRPMYLVLICESGVAT